MRPLDPERLPELEAELASLEGMSLGELRAFWPERWGFAPTIRSIVFLRQMIAWRLQAEIFGGLEPETRKLLKRKSMPRPPRLPAGVGLTREYRGVLYQVEVREEAFLYGGREYDSLSEIARTITGTRWNGPRFFGLRDRSQAHA